MSLVSEALKKAEREAAAREAREKGLPTALETPLQPYRARRSGHGISGRRWTPLFALLGGAAAVAVAMLVARTAAQKKDSAKESVSAPESLRRTTAGGEGPAAAMSAQKVAASAAAPRPEESEKSAESGESAEPAAPPEATLPSPKTAVQKPPPEPSGRELSTAKTPAPFPSRTAVSPARAAAESSAPSPAKAASAGAKPAAPARRGAGDYLRRVDFPDGSKLELGGIVYSETAPFAYLNGRLVGVGELVGDYRIDKIERERVLLSGEAGAITLRLKGP
ncbi:MAG: hypothetical protein ABI639_00660 [Thermoanaerobaculia bacterium]